MKNYPCVITVINRQQINSTIFSADVKIALTKLGLIHKINTILLDQKIYTAYHELTGQDYTEDRYNEIITNFCNNLK